jgi:hypothetical protein
MTDATFREWAILELMGHRLAGHVSEATIGGAPFLRIDIPRADGQPPITQYYSGSSVYALTPTSEALAKRAAALFRPAPVNRWELASVDPVNHGDDLDEAADALVDDVIADADRGPF